ncbi:hypothetical protein VTH82DRAFT_495 [Thermothelomyces myriococcoides]
MTSVERDGENVYSLGDLKVEQPKYSILSYTWGRWRVKGKEAATSAALPINGTPWRVPPIEKDHFTVDTFRKVIQLMADVAGVSWVWADVGCIDQREDDPVSGFVNTQAPGEIGRQSSIYKNAAAAFVWLCGVRKSELSAAVDVLMQQGLDFISWAGDSSKREMMGAFPDDKVQDLAKSFDIILNDPWFSSIWTLQELVLRNDALVLAAEGEPVLWIRDEPHERRMYLIMLISFCKNAYTAIETTLAGRRSSPNNTSWKLSDQAESALRRIKQQILQAGIYCVFSTNPNVQYGMARYRFASFEEDRVYGIMQIYGLRLGKAARPETKPTLRELVREMAEAINKMSPILGQYFVHTSASCPNVTWHITEQSFVPDDLMI